MKNINAMIKKIDKDIFLEVDGGVNSDNSHILLKAGANLLVAGSSVFSGGPENYKKNIASLRHFQDKE